MQSLESNNSHQAASADSKTLLIAATWFGLLSGLVEGTGLLVFQHYGWLVWDLALNGVSAPIIWISAIFNAVIFLLAAVLLFAATRILRNLPWVAISVFVFTFISVFDLLALIRRTRHLAMVVLAIGIATVALRGFRKREARVIKIWRSSLPALAAIAIVCLIVVEAGGRFREHQEVQHLAAARQGLPNIVIIVVDTLRSDHLSTYGYARPTSPNLSRVAAQGVLFENAFAASSWTVPSHASLLTGRYPHEHGTESGFDPLDHRYPTLSEALRDRGYRTGGFSANTLFFCKRLGFDRGFLHFEDYFETVGDMVSRTMLGREFNTLVRPRIGLVDAPARRHASDINNETLGWIDRAPGRPFMVFLNYFDNHQPYLPPAPYRTRFQTNPQAPVGAANSLLFRDVGGLSPEQIQAEVAAYDGATAYVDAQIGTLLAELPRRGLDRNTLLIITSDHGESLGEHGLFGHRQSLYRDEIQVPLVFWWPGHLPAGSRITAPVSNVNLPATVLDLIGDDSPQFFPGDSLAKLWTGSVLASPWPAPLSELSRLPSGSKEKLTYHGWMKSLVTADWHYILHEKFGPQLYKWSADPDETKDLAPGQREVVDGLDSQLRSRVPGIRVPVQQSARAAP